MIRFEAEPEPTEGASESRGEGSYKDALHEALLARSMPELGPDAARAKIEAAREAAAAIADPEKRAEALRDVGNAESELAGEGDGGRVEATISPSRMAAEAARRNELREELTGGRETAAAFEPFATESPQEERAAPRRLSLGQRLRKYLALAGVIGVGFGSPEKGEAAGAQTNAPPKGAAVYGRGVPAGEEGTLIYSRQPGVSVEIDRPGARQVSGVERAGGRTNTPGAHVERVTEASIWAPQIVKRARAEVAQLETVKDADAFLKTYVGDFVDNYKLVAGRGLLEPVGDPFAVRADFKLIREAAGELSKIVAEVGGKFPDKKLHLERRQKELGNIMADALKQSSYAAEKIRERTRVRDAMGSPYGGEWRGGPGREPPPQTYERTPTYRR